MHYATSLYGMFADSGGSNILASLGTFVVSVGTLLGIWFSRRQVPATIELSLAQTRKTDAEAKKTEAEARKADAEAQKVLAERDAVIEGSAGTALQTVAKSLIIVTRELDTTRAKLVAVIDERDEWKRRAEIAEAATALMNNLAKSERAKRKWLDGAEHGE